MKFRRTNKVGKFEVKKVKNKGAVNKNVVRSRSLHAPLDLFYIEHSGSSCKGGPTFYLNFFSVFIYFTLALDVPEIWRCAGIKSVYESVCKLVTVCVSQHANLSLCV